MIFPNKFKSRGWGRKTKMVCFNPWGVSKPDKVTRKEPKNQKGSQTAGS